MKPTFLLLFLAFISVCLFSQNKGANSLNDLDYYRELNNKEVRLMDYKDNEESLKLKVMQVGVINKSRKRYRASPVRLDILASRVAN